jgi:hypothetical protein
LPLLAYSAWTLGAWLLDGPHPITTYRETSGVALIFARLLEVATILLTITVAAVTLRRCVRQRRLTFEAKMLIALAAAVFWDTLLWFDAPVWLYSENWLNLNDWWGHAPLATNPVAGAAPMPVLMQLGMYIGFPFAGLLASSALMRRAQARWPRLTTPALFGITTLIVIPTFVFGSYLLNVLHLWSSGDAKPFLLTGVDWRMSIGEPLWAVPWALALLVLWYFRDQHGRALTERGLDRLSARTRSAVSLLATIAYVSLASIVLETAMIIGLHVITPQPYPHLPKSLLGEVCEAPGWDSTVYGPCPAPVTDPAKRQGHHRPCTYPSSPTDHRGTYKRHPRQSWSFSSITTAKCPTRQRRILSQSVPPRSEMRAGTSKMRRDNWHVYAGPAINRSTYSRSGSAVVIVA